MKRSIVIFVISAIFVNLFLFGQTLSTQGVLRDASGKSVADGNYTMTFRLYTVETGGSNVWNETQTVAVKNGVYNVILGKLSPLSSLNYNQAYFLAIVMDGIEMLPRVEMTLSPYALTNVQGISNVFPQSGNVGIGTTSPTTNLHVKGNASIANTEISVYTNSTHPMDLPGGSTSGTFIKGPVYAHIMMGIDGNDWSDSWSVVGRGSSTSDYKSLIHAKVDGKVGIGTTNPVEKLHVNGKIGLPWSGGLTVPGSAPGWQSNVLDWTWTTGIGDNLRFYVPGQSNSSNPMMVITESGKVGINNVSPVDNLDVHGSGRFYYPGSDTRLEIAADNGRWSFLRFSDSDGGDWDIGSISGGYSNGFQIKEPGKSPVVVVNKNGDVEIHGNIKLYGNLDVMQTFKGIRWGGSDANRIMQHDNGSYVSFESNNRTMIYYYNGNTFAHYSDMRLKQNTKPLNKTLERLKKLDAFTHDFKKDVLPEGLLPDGRHYGVSAQEVKKLFPELVGEASHPTKKDESYLTVNYIEFVPVLIQAINDQQNIIEDLEKRLATLEKMTKAQ